MTTATVAAETMTYVDPCPGKKGDDLAFIEECWKCTGTGTVSWGANVDGAVRDANGATRIVPKVCFKCNGVGKFRISVKTARARARRDVKAHNDRIAAAAREEAERPARIAAEIARVLDEAYAENARIDAIVDCPTGVETIVGVILTIKSQEGYYGRTDLKMLVADDRGFKVWGTFPSAFYSDKQDANRGDRVSFVATIKQSDRDRDFGFFKAPKQTRVIERATSEEN